MMNDTLSPQTTTVIAMLLGQILGALLFLVIYEWSQRRELRKLKEKNKRRRKKVTKKKDDVNSQVSHTRQKTVEGKRYVGKHVVTEVQVLKRRPTRDGRFLYENPI